MEVTQESPGPTHKYALGLLSPRRVSASLSDPWNVSWRGGKGPEPGKSGIWNLDF